MKKYIRRLTGIWITIVLINLLAWFSAPFCDWYVSHVFPLWVNTYGRLTGSVPFSVGEWMLYLAALYVAVNLLLCMPAWFLTRRGRGRKLLRWLALTPWFVTVVCIIMTLNCTILYHCTPLEKQLLEKMRMQTQGVQEEPMNASLEQLVALREEIVLNCNRLAKEMPRDAQGYIVYTADNSLAKEAIVSMRGIADEFLRLSGYYPNPKPLAASWFFSQQYMCGYYFPFSMEANYNDMMYLMNIPYTMCHELSHLKGYIYEDEANFLAYLACVGSGNKLFEYSGYLGVLYYVDSDLRKALEACGQPMYYEHLTPIDKQVCLDSCFLTPEAWSEVEERAFLDTELVEKASDAFLEANLTLNGVEDGTLSYSRVVELMLLYRQIK